MNRLLSSFLDRLAERFTAIAASVVSSRVEGLQAVAQAEQQSQLEDLARTYEAEGKTAIARALRRRADRLTSTDLAAEAVEVMEAVAREPLKLTSTERSRAVDDLPGLPDFSKPTKRSKRRRSSGDSTNGTNASGPGATGVAP